MKQEMGQHLHTNSPFGSVGVFFPTLLQHQTMVSVCLSCAPARRIRFSTRRSDTTRIHSVMKYPSEKKETTYWSWNMLRFILLSLNKRCDFCSHPWCTQSLLVVDIWTWLWLIIHDIPRYLFHSFPSSLSLFSFLLLSFETPLFAFLRFLMCV